MTSERVRQLESARKSANQLIDSMKKLMADIEVKKQQNQIKARAIDTKDK